jgi:hypothetical protein
MVMNLKTLTRGFFLVPAVVMFANAGAQPGWRDMSRRFSYELLDSVGKPIAFASNAHFEIQVGEKFYSGISIPHDSLGPAALSARVFEDQVRINDFALKIPQQILSLPRISVIQGGDTMYLWPAQNIRMAFAPGAWYFPAWSGVLLNRETFQTTGKLQLVNREINALRVPVSVFLQQLAAGYDREKPLEKLVRGQVTEPWFQVHKEDTPIQIEGVMKPFKRPRWEGALFPTSDPGAWLGQVAYTLDTASLYWTVNAVARFQPGSNKIVLWKPKSKPEQFYTSKIFRDPFNQYFYMVAGVRDTIGTINYGSDFDKHPYISDLYRGSKDGRSWQQSPALTALYRKGAIEELAFLDKRHVLAHFTRYPPGKQPLYRTQGVFYLLRDWVIVDSFITPAAFSFQDNYNGYSFKLVSDSAAALGHWGLSGNTAVGTITDLSLRKRKGQWYFFTEIGTEEAYWKRAGRSQPPVPDSSVAYDNFELVQGRLLRYAHGTLLLPADPVRIAAQGSTVFILMTDSFLFSLDGGVNWYFYPAALSEKGIYNFPKLSADNQLYYYDLDTMLHHRVQVTFHR